MDRQICPKEKTVPRTDLSIYTSDLCKILILYYNICRLLREMGWNEADQEEYEITEDEKKEFQNLSKQVMCVFYLVKCTGIKLVNSFYCIALINRDVWFWKLIMLIFASIYPCRWYSHFCMDRLLGKKIKIPVQSLSTFHIIQHFLYYLLAIMYKDQKPSQLFWLTSVFTEKALHDNSQTFIFFILTFRCSSNAMVLSEVFLKLGALSISQYINLPPRSSTKHCRPQILIAMMLSFDGV